MNTGLRILLFSLVFSCQFTLDFRQTTLVDVSVVSSKKTQLVTLALERKVGRRGFLESPQSGPLPRYLDARQPMGPPSPTTKPRVLKPLRILLLLFTMKSLWCPALVTRESPIPFSTYRVTALAMRKFRNMQPAATSEQKQNRYGCRDSQGRISLPRIRSKGRASPSSNPPRSSLK